MGTHSHIFMRVKQAQKLITYCKLYFQFDGYIEGVGTDLIKFLVSKKLVNGISLTEDMEKIANGPECLFAMTVAHFKKRVGGVYLVDPTDPQEEEWNYYVEVDELDGSIQLIIKGEHYIKKKEKSVPFNFSGTVQEAHERFAINKEQDNDTDSS